MSSEQVAKVVVVFQAAGGAPLLKQDKVKISVDSHFSKVVAFLRKQLHSDSVFVYLRNAFCPALDEQLGVLTKAYGTDGKLHRDAPPVAAPGGPPLAAAEPVPGFDVAAHAARMAGEITQQVQATEALLQLLPYGLGCSSSSSGQEGQGGFTAEVRQLQQQHAEVSQQLAAAVGQAEGELLQLQALYAALAKAKLQAQAQASQG
ncbi:hypothetical protein OEZ86_003474 [Tetradesmus obliquus]|nr:hypothetical protein OEZ86_003474 [Tetradesmus obliquus]